MSSYRIREAAESDRWHIIERLQDDYKKTKNQRESKNIHVGHDFWHDLTDILVAYDRGELHAILAVDNDNNQNHHNSLALCGYLVLLKILPEEGDDAPLPQWNIQFLHVFDEFQRQGVGSWAVQDVRMRIQEAETVYAFAAAGAQGFWQRQQGFTRDECKISRYNAKGLKT